MFLKKSLESNSQENFIETSKEIFIDFKNTPISSIPKINLISDRMTDNSEILLCPSTNRAIITNKLNRIKLLSDKKQNG